MRSMVLQDSAGNTKSGTTQLFAPKLPPACLFRFHFPNPDFFRFFGGGGRGGMKHQGARHIFRQATTENTHRWCFVVQCKTVQQILKFNKVVTNEGKQVPRTSTGHRSKENTSQTQTQTQTHTQTHTQTQTHTHTQTQTSRLQMQSVFWGANLLRYIYKDADRVQMLFGKENATDASAAKSWPLPKSHI